MFGFVSLGVSFASLVISCAALYWSRMARIEAAGAVDRSRYALESSRKHVGLPYDHKIVHDWELRTQFGFAPQIKDDWTRRKDSDGVADSDDAFEVFSDGTYRIVPNSGVFSVLKPVFCREHGTCDDPACPYAICAGVQRVRTSLVLCPRSLDWSGRGFCGGAIVMKNRMVSPVSSGSLPQSFMTHSLCLPRTVSPICRQSHSPASQFTPIALTLKALPSPQFTRYPTIGGSMPALLKSGRRSLSPSSMAKSGAASALHLQPRANVNSDTMSPKAAMTTVIQVCTVRPRNVICARSTPIDSSFLRHLRRLVFCAIPSLRIRGKEPFSNRSTDGGCRG